LQYQNSMLVAGWWSDSGDGKCCGLHPPERIIRAQKTYVKTLLLTSFPPLAVLLSGNKQATKAANSPMRNEPWLIFSSDAALTCKRLNWPHRMISKGYAVPDSISP
jgi:hypothetical protein